MPSYKVECPDCEVIIETEDFETAVKFADKHKTHTGHEMEWIQAEFESGEFDFGNEWELTCSACGETWYFQTQDEANAFKDEHTKFTDHEISDSPTEHRIDVLSRVVDINKDTIRSIIAELEDHFEDGAPEEAIFGMMGAHNGQISEIREKLDQLAEEDEIEHPSPGHYTLT